MPTILGLNSQIFSAIVRPRRLAATVLVAAAISWTQLLPAQKPATPAPPATTHKTAHRHKHAAAAPAQSSPQAAALPTAPPAPEMPLWPANERPSDAAVTWDSQGLRINAANSSLQQILKDVATATGATVEGLDADERIFGFYGPGKARDVLSQLLQGTAYNVLMIGDQGEGTPRDIILSSRHAGAATAVAANPQSANEDDTDTADDQPPAPTPPTPRPGFGPGGQRTPQQLQELQQRQQQMQQQGGQPQQQPPVNPQN